MFNRLIIGILIVWFSTLYGQTETNTSKLQISGYYEPQYMGFINTEAWQQLMSNKIRIDLYKKFSPDLIFQANVNYITYHGNTVWDILDFIPTISETYVSQNARPYLYLNYRDEQFLDNIFLTYFKNSFRLTVGKQQLSFGSGFVWNPTDFFNTKQLIDPTYEQPGHNALRMDWGFGTSSELTFVFQPGDDTKFSTYYGRIKTTLGHFDLALVGGTKPWTFTYNTAYTPYQRTLRRKIGGMDINGELFGVGVYLEGSYNEFPDHQDFIEMVGGLDYTFGNGLYILLEYFFHDGVPDDAKQLTLDEWIQYFNGEMRTITRHQAYFMLSYPWSDITTVSLSPVYNPIDQSMALIPMLQVSLNDDLMFTAIGQMFIGESTDIFNKNLGNGLTVRLRYYF